jgi:Zn-dependent M28 family amino/carboxypeptidase
MFDTGWPDAEALGRADDAAVVAAIAECAQRIKTERALNHAHVAERNKPLPS